MVSTEPASAHGGEHTTSPAAICSARLRLGGFACASRRRPARRERPHEREPVEDRRGRPTCRRRSARCRTTIPKPSARISTIRTMIEHDPTDPGREPALDGGMTRPRSRSPELAVGRRLDAEALGGLLQVVGAPLGQRERGVGHPAQLQALLRPGRGDRTLEVRPGRLGVVALCRPRPEDRLRGGLVAGLGLELLVGAVLELLDVEPADSAAPSASCAAAWPSVVQSSRLRGVHRCAVGGRRSVDATRLARVEVLAPRTRGGDVPNAPLEVFAGRLGTLITSHVANAPRWRPVPSSGTLCTRFRPPTRAPTVPASSGPTTCGAGGSRTRAVR